MAWKRAKGKGRLFSDKQKDQIVELAKSGMTKTEIIKEVGIHRSGLDHILASRLGSVDISAYKGRRKRETVEAVVAASLKQDASREQQERDYLLWALRGALSKVGGTNYVDRLIADIRDGRLG